MKFSLQQFRSYISLFFRYATQHIGHRDVEFLRYIGFFLFSWRWGRCCMQKTSEIRSGSLHLFTLNPTVSALLKSALCSRKRKVEFNLIWTANTFFFYCLFISQLFHCVTQNLKHKIITIIFFSIGRIIFKQTSYLSEKKEYPISMHIIKKL